MTPRIIPSRLARVSLPALLSISSGGIGMVVVPTWSWISRAAAAIVAVNIASRGNFRKAATCLSRRLQAASQPASGAFGHLILARSAVFGRTSA